MSWRNDALCPFALSLLSDELRRGYARLAQGPGTSHMVKELLTTPSFFQRVGGLMRLADCSDVSIVSSWCRNCVHPSTFVFGTVSANTAVQIMKK